MKTTPCALLSLIKHIQQVFKTNLLYDATTTINLGVDVGLSKRVSFNVEGNINPWIFGDNSKIQQLSVEAGPRYWFAKTFKGHFLGIEGIYGQYNFGGVGPAWWEMSQNRYRGEVYGAGVVYGHSWRWGGRWGVEASMGLGVLRLHYDKYNWNRCGRYIDSHTRDYLGPTKLAVSLTFLLGKGGKRASAQSQGVSYVVPQVQNAQKPVNPTTDTTRQNKVPVGDTITHKVQKTSKTYTSIYFELGSADLLPAFADNSKQLRELRAQVNKGNIKKITIEGYCSPEGSEILNANLSQQRARIIAQYISNLQEVKPAMVSLNAEGVDWKTLRTVATVLNDKDLLNIIDDHLLSPQEKQNRIKRLEQGLKYKEIENTFYRMLRRVDVIVEHNK